MPLNFCAFKNIFGESKKGVHAYRLMFSNNNKFNYSLKISSTEDAGIAVVDLFFTIIAAIILAIILKQNVVLIFITLMIVSMFMHVLFCVDTTLTLKVKEFLNKTKAIFGV